MNGQAQNVTVAASGKTLVFKDASCVLTMECADARQHESSSPVLLGAKKNVDVVIVDGKIAEICSSAAQKYTQNGSTQIIDARGLVLMPGLIDCHAHPIFAGSRAEETVLKSQGMTYEEIAARGGGIARSMRATREASSEALSAGFLRNSQTALSRGVVLLEAKTGYGLNPTEELRLLECMYTAIAANEQAAHGQPLPKIAPTMLAPHAASPEFHGLDAYIQALVDFLPQYVSCARAAEGKLQVLPLAVDVFVERNYFSREQGEKWLGAALQYGLDVHIHADEFSRSGGSQVAIALAERLEQTAERKRQRGRVLSVDHCQYSTESDLALLQRMGVTPVVLPCTSFMSNISYVEAKRWRSGGIRPAIASDFNPGSSPVNNLWFAAFLALTRCGFALPEVISGVTTQAAKALGAELEYGTLSVGRPAHLVAFEGDRPEDFFASPLGDHVRHVVLGC